MIRVGLRWKIGFVRYFLCFLCFFLFQFRAQGAEAVEFLDGAAVVALGLGLVTEEEEPGVGLPGLAVEAFGDGEIVFLAEGDFTVAHAGHVLVHGVDGLAARAESLVETSGEETGFEAGGTDEGHLVKGDAFDGPEFLGVGGAVEGDEVVAEGDDFVEVFEMGDGEA